MVRVAHIKRVDGKPVVVLSEWGRKMVFNKRSLEERIKTLEKQHIDTNVERKALTRLEEEEEVK